MTDHLPTGQARELLHKLNGQRVRVAQHTLGGDLVIEVGYLHYEQETRTWGIRDAVVTYPAADVYVDPRHLINVTPEQRGVLWDYVHRAVCEAGVAEGAAEQLADRMLAALTVEDTATVERISRTYHRQPLSRRPDQQPIRTREDLADFIAPGVAREQAEQVAERLMPRLTRRDALIRAQRTQIEELLAQLDRYRLAWRSARRRAAQYRDDRDGTVWVHPYRQGGTACVGGTRVSAALIASLLADGMTVEEIATGYPSVTPAGARAAAAFAARYVDRDQVAHNGCSQQHNEHPDDDLPTPEPLPCGATAPLHSGGEAVCTRPAGHTTHIADNGARWTEDPYRTDLPTQVRQLAKTYGYRDLLAEVLRQDRHIQEQP